MDNYLPSLNFIDLKKQQENIREDINFAISKVLDHGKYIMGPEVFEFEDDLKNFTGAKHVISCANGTDALTIALMALGVKQDDVIFVPSFTYIASVESITQLGAIPFYVDVNIDTFNIDLESLKNAILDARKMNLNIFGIMPVDLFGQPAQVDLIQNIADENNLKILIDAAQSFGGEYKNKKVGNYGDITTTSFFPAKPLGCYGDGGALFTNCDELYEKISSIRLHGKGSHKYEHIQIGVNSRLDTIQAAILQTKLKIFPDELLRRQQSANIYNDMLSKHLETPIILDNAKSSWAQYTLKSKQRNEIQHSLNLKKIPTMIYYPIPISKQKPYSSFPRVSSGLTVSEKLPELVLSLPMHPYLTKENIQFVSHSILELI